LQDNSGNELRGKFTPWQLIQYAMYQTPQTFTNSVVINNLFHTSMNDAAGQTSIDQCAIDVKTFQTDVPIQYESSPSHISYHCLHEHTLHIQSQ